jgi:hypothetical protein
MGKMTARTMAASDLFMIVSPRYCWIRVNPDRRPFIDRGRFDYPTLADEPEKKALVRVDDLFEHTG